MSTLSRGGQWGIIIGGYVAYRLMKSVARSQPHLAPFLEPLLVLYVVFAIMTWLADPLFNLVLRLSRYGRYALSRDQRIGSTGFGLCVLAALTFLILGFTASPFYLLPALLTGLISLPLSAVFHCPKGWPRLAMIGYTLALAAVGGGAIAATLRSAPEMRLDDTAFGPLFTTFLLGILASAFVANGLAMTRPRQ